MAINLFSGGNTINSLQAAGKNAIINGGMDIWQRGTSFSVAASTAAYTADRWQIKTNANQASTISRQTTSDTTNLPSIQYCLRFQRNSGQTGTGSFGLAQSFETVNSIPLAGNTVTFSFYARRGANYSATGNGFVAYLVSGTGTDQDRIDGPYTGDNTSIVTTVTLTTTWQRFSVTGTLPTTATEIAPYFIYTPTGTAGAADYFEVTGCQIELGSTPTTFARCGSTLGGELSLCQRYYQKSYDQATTPGSAVAAGALACICANPTDRFLTSSKWVVPMRVAPTMTVWSQNGTSGKLTTTAGADAGSSVIGDNIFESSVRSIYSATGLTTSALYYYQFAVSAEI